MRQNMPNQTAGRPGFPGPAGCLGAGGPVWYTVLAVSFLSCSLNPVGAAGLAMHILTPHDIYSKPIGWLLTSGSFVIAIMGFIATERVAYMELHRRALEIASLLACGAGVLAFAIGFTLPAYIMWPIAAILVLVGAIGFRGATSLPIPGMAATGTTNPADRTGLARRHDSNVANVGNITRDTDLVSDAVDGPTPRRKRRRRRRRKPHGSQSKRPADGGD
jgi:hypothetical protein